jgi:hypothetical protein
VALPSFRDFAEAARDAEHFARLDGDWSIAVADVVASTQLAANGRDRDVNFVAAGVVAVLQSVLDSPDAIAACQFGGDGAIAAVPPERRMAARDALQALAHWAQAEFNVPLRVGMVPVSALIKAGLEVRVALNDFGNGNAFGLFLGGGVAAADTWVKQDPKWRLEPKQGELPGLAGVSCRWNPVSPKRGIVLCIIVDSALPGAAGMAAVSRVQDQIEAIVSTEAASPFGQGERLLPTPFPPWRSLMRELRTEPPGRRPLRLLKALAGALIIYLVHKAGGKVGPVDSDAYRRSTAIRTDYRKQAGGPRMVLDVTEEEARRIEAVLDQAERDGEIHFGTARADAASMTCLVGDFAADRHVHFVDGSRLGFWRASVPLKEKMRRAAAELVVAQGDPA